MRCNYNRDVLKRHKILHQDSGRHDAAGNYVPSRVLMACDRCHLRKERCSGEVPCLRCLVNGSQCRHSRVSSSPSIGDLPLLNVPVRARREAMAAPSLRPNFTSRIAISNNVDHRLGKRTVPQGPASPNQASFADDSCFIAQAICSHEIPPHASSVSRPSADNMQQTPLLQVQNAFMGHSLISSLSFGANDSLLDAIPTIDSGAWVPSNIQPDDRYMAGESGLTEGTSNWQSTSMNGSTPSSGESSSHPHLNQYSLFDIRQPSILQVPTNIWTLTSLFCTPALLDLYFDEFAYSWPLLHRGRFFSALEQQPLELLCSAALLGTLFESNTDSQVNQRSAAKSLHEWLLESLSTYLNQRREEGLGRVDGSHVADLAAAQALLLSIIYGICTDQVMLRVRLCSSFGTLVEWIREAGLFQHDHQIMLPSTTGIEMDEYHRWTAIESKKRLAFAAFRLDCYISLCYDRGPIIRFQEVCVPLPSSDALWNAAHPGAWRLARQLEPSGRLQRTFSSLCTSAFAGLTHVAVPVLLEEDYELALCALQGSLWEASLQQHEQSILPHSSDGSIHRTSEQIAIERSEAWKAQLESWHTHRNRSQQVNADYSSLAHRRSARFSGTMMYLFSFLRIHADIVLIRRLVASLDLQRGRSASPAASVTSRYLESRLSAWTETSNARVALRCAAQVLQIYVQEEIDRAAAPVFRPVVDLMGVGCMFRAALVVWAYTRSTLSCDTCMDVSAESSYSLRGGPFGPQVACEIGGTGVDLDLHAISGWISSGGKALINGIPVCACTLPLMLESFISAMRGCALLVDFVKPLADVLENLKYCH